jgi:SAM-dependent methyltransferase
MSRAAARPTERFTGREQAYAANRPSYGDDVVAFVLEGLRGGSGAAPRVADLGAGAGISARRLAAHGAQVLAVEPNAAMRATAGSANDGGVQGDITWVDGTGEKTTLSAASVDAATAFQAFHWFANDAALAEIVRIVRRGGSASLVLNERDHADPFTAAYGDVVRRYAEDDTEQRRQDSLTVFRRLPGTCDDRFFPNTQTLDLAGLIGRTQSSSYLPREGERGERLVAEVQEVFARFARDGRVTFAIITEVLRVRLPR